MFVSVDEICNKYNLLKTNIEINFDEFVDIFNGNIEKYKNDSSYYRIIGLYYKVVEKIIMRQKNI